MKEKQSQCGCLVWLSEGEAITYAPFDGLVIYTEHMHVFIEQKVCSRSRYMYLPVCMHIYRVDK